MIEIYATCPECGNYKFEREDNGFKCPGCGKILSQEDMSLKTEVREMCEYCSDLRYVEPACYLWVGDKNEQIESWLQKARDEKKFVEIIFKDGKTYGFNIIDECPECHYVFTKDDYERYEFE